jgi:hypothetical protein
MRWLTANRPALLRRALLARSWPHTLGGEPQAARPIRSVLVDHPAEDPSATYPFGRRRMPPQAGPRDDRAEDRAEGQPAAGTSRSCCRRSRGAPGFGPSTAMTETIPMPSHATIDAPSSGSRRRQDADPQRSKIASPAHAPRIAAATSNGRRPPQSHGSPPREPHGRRRPTPTGRVRARGSRVRSAAPHASRGRPARRSGRHPGPRRRRRAPPPDPARPPRPACPCGPASGGRRGARSSPRSARRGGGSGPMPGRLARDPRRDERCMLDGELVRLEILAAPSWIVFEIGRCRDIARRSQRHAEALPLADRVRRRPVCSRPSPSPSSIGPARAASPPLAQRVAVVAARHEADLLALGLVGVTSPSDRRPPAPRLGQLAQREPACSSWSWRRPYRKYVWSLSSSRPRAGARGLRRPDDARVVAGRDRLALVQVRAAPSSARTSRTCCSRRTGSASAVEVRVEERLRRPRRTPARGS